MFKTIGVTAASIAALALILPIATNPSAFGLLLREHIGVGHIGVGHVYGGHIGYGGHYAGGSHVIVGHAYGHHFLYRGHSCVYIINQLNQYQLYCPGIGIIP